MIKYNLAAKPQEKLPNAAADPSKPVDAVKQEKPKIKMISVDQGN